MQVRWSIVSTYNTVSLLSGTQYKLERPWFIQWGDKVIANVNMKYYSYYRKKTFDPLLLGCFCTTTHHLATQWLSSIKRWDIAVLLTADWKYGITFFTKASGVVNICVAEEVSEKKTSMFSVPSEVMSMDSYDLLQSLSTCCLIRLTRGITMITLVGGSEINKDKCSQQHTHTRNINKNILLNKQNSYSAITFTTGEKHWWWVSIKIKTVKISNQCCARLL